MKAIISDIHGNLEALQAVLARHRQAGRHRDLLPGRRHRLRPEPARVHRPGDGLQAGPAGQPRPGGHVRPGRVQPARPSGPSSGPATSWNPPAETAASPREALGVPRRAAAQPPRERLPVRPRLGPQPAQRVRLPRGHLQPAEDGAHLRAGRAVLLPGPHPRPRRLHREAGPASSTAPRRSTTRTSSTAARRCATSARSASRATATRGPATSCSTATRSASAASSTTSRRRSRRSTPSPTWTTSSATGSARGVELARDGRTNRGMNARRPPKYLRGPLRFRPLRYPNATA